MNLRTAASSQRGVPVEGYDFATSTWVPEVSRGSLKSPAFVTRPDGFSRQKIFACSHLLPIPYKYRLLRFPDQTHAVIESSTANQWKGGIYQYVYQLRMADFQVSIYSFVKQYRASGVMGAPDRELQLQTYGDVIAAGKEHNIETSVIDYSRVRVVIPGDVPLTEDNELDINGQTYGIVSMQRTPLAWEAAALRRSN